MSVETILGPLALLLDGDEVGGAESSFVLGRVEDAEMGPMVPAVGKAKVAALLGFSD
jgi:hypothetical protein